jgi:bacillithiol synthase
LLSIKCQLLTFQLLNIYTLSFEAVTVPYEATGFFSKIVLDYIAGADTLQPFYTYEATVKGIEDALAKRGAYNCNRQLLVTELTKQYQAVAVSEKVQQHIARLANDNTFTICTAHQPNIFTGHLYFIYKILHAIKLANHLKEVLPQYDFVPVYYMGSEDADLDELGEVTIGGIKYHWETKQHGAVGRMLVDDALLRLVQAIAGQLLVQPHGAAIVELIHKCYTKGATIQQATFLLVNELFGEYGLVVLLPDNAALKQTMVPVFADELLHGTSAAIVAATSAQLENNYKVQARPREINLFYLIDDKRERIELQGDRYHVLNTSTSFTKSAILEELEQHPERFSPNVILRGLYQETILPNVAFIGGGGELAYWLQLKALFEHYQVPFPVQVLRNSFMVVDEQVAKKIKNTQLSAIDLFKNETSLLNELVKQKTTLQLALTNEKDTLMEYYKHLKGTAGAIDVTLKKHVEAIASRALQQVSGLEKKMLRAEKRKYETDQRHIKAIKNTLFPGNSLQERVDNIMPYYATFGSGFIALLYTYSPVNQPVFTILIKKGEK